MISDKYDYGEEVKPTATLIMRIASGASGIHAMLKAAKSK